MHALVVGDGRVHVRGQHTDPVAGADGALGLEGDVFVGAKPHLRSLDRGIAMIHAEGLETAVRDRIAR